MSTLSFSDKKGTGKKLLLQVMKYEDLLNWKNKCFRKYCSTKLNWQGSATIIIYCEGASWGGWHTVVQCRSAFFLQQDTAQRLDCLHIKGWAKRKSARGNMRKESRINNQSVEQRGSGGAWGGYHILDFNTRNGGVLCVLDCSKIQCCSQEHLWIVNRVENAFAWHAVANPLRIPLHHFQMPQ